MWTTVLDKQSRQTEERKLRSIIPPPFKMKKKSKYAPTTKHVRPHKATRKSAQRVRPKKRQNTQRTYDRPRILKEYCHQGKCFDPTKQYKIKAVDEIFAFFGGSNDAFASPSEIGNAFNRIDTSDDGYLGPLELFDATVGVFTRLCEQPEYISYFHDKIKDSKHYYYGAEAQDHGRKTRANILDRDYTGKGMSPKKPRDRSKVEYLDKTKEQASLKYPFFGMFDADRDGKISRSEWIRVFAKHDMNRDRKLSYNDFYVFLSQHADHICSDPRGKPELEETHRSELNVEELKERDFVSILSKIYYFLDSNQNGQIQPNDVRLAFKSLDLDRDMHIGREEFDSMTGPAFKEMCYQAAKFSDQTSCPTPEILDCSRDHDIRRTE